MECSFCKKVFGSKTALEHHKKTAKYCLKIQGTESVENFECSYCKKLLCTNERLMTHNAICKEKKRQENIEKEKKTENNFNEQKNYYEDKLKEKNEYIAKLEAKLEKFENIILESKTEKKSLTTNNTTNTTNNIVINALNLNDIEKMTSFLEEKLDKNVLAGGQKGLAKLLSETMLKDRYKCVDPSRQNFEFTNELGELERDVKAKKLTNALIKGDICSKSADKGIKLWTKDDGSTDSLSRQAHSSNVFDMINFDRDNSTFRSELTALTS